MEFSQKIRELMALHEIGSEAQLASLINVSQATLNRLLVGKTKKPNQLLLKKITDFFQISFDVLISDIPKHTIFISESDRYHDSASSVLRYLMSDIGNISEGELSRRTCVPQPTIHRILVGNTSNPRLESIEPLANFFNITTDQLLARTPLPSDRIPGTFINKNIKQQFIPLITWEEISSWPEISVSQTRKLISTESSIGSKSFAVKIETDQFSPEFRLDTLLIIDYSRTPRNNEFIILTDPANEIYIGQLTLISDLKFVTPLSSSQEIDFQQCKLHGVIIEARRTLLSAD